LANPQYLALFYPKAGFELLMIARIRCLGKLRLPTELSYLQQVANLKGSLANSHRLFSLLANPQYLALFYPQNLLVTPVIILKTLRNF